MRDNHAFPTEDTMQSDKELDARGLSCPLPILKTKKALADMQSGQTLRVLLKNLIVKNERFKLSF